MEALVFYLVAGITVASALGVAFSRNIVYSAFALMGTFMGAAGLFVMLAADFIAVVQVLVYVGGILVLMLFAVMLTHRIADVQVSNRSVGTLPALAIVTVLGGVMGRAILTTEWHTIAQPEAQPATYAIGEGFLTTYLLPFELASLVLLAALIGAVVLSRKELKATD
ncbi:MAG TPA: NADH-quinone oxidoreductase subunit J [Candidatus Binatia bacterium]|nr:NADH-quinone oxidoreductase subunit J [Candidatus Binatia bacterium]